MAFFTYFEMLKHGRLTFFLLILHNPDTEEASPSNTHEGFR